MYRTLFQKADPDRIVKAGIIGTGRYAKAIVSQSGAIDRLDIPAVADVDVDAATEAFVSAGCHRDSVQICETNGTAMEAWNEGKRVVVPDGSLLMDLPIDIVVESTGIPEAAAKYCLDAIEHGKHLAVVSKDLDIAVGPILKRKAERAGLVYTQVDGDQHGLLVQLVEWAKELGLEPICGGKFLQFDLVLDPGTATISYGGESSAIGAEDMGFFHPHSGNALLQAHVKRREAIGEMGRVRGFDTVEMALAANTAGLKPDTPALHGPILRTREIPDLLCDAGRGGILAESGAVDAVACLRSPHEASMGGGVFLVIGCDNAYSREIMLTKGVMPNSAGNAGLVYRPYHLCGVETPISIIAAVLLGEPTSGRELKPVYDVHAEALSTLESSSIVEKDNSSVLRGLLHPASAANDGSKAPWPLARGNRLKRSLEAGSVIGVDDIDVPRSSTLWALRREQDSLFLT